LWNRPSQDSFQSSDYRAGRGDNYEDKDRHHDQS
jgi:hypothetical protein